MIKNSIQNVAFYLSVQNNNNQAINHLITAKDLDVNYINLQFNQNNNNNNAELYDTPLIIAVKNCNFESIRLITSHPSFIYIIKRDTL